MPKAALLQLATLQFSQYCEHLVLLMQGEWTSAMPRVGMHHDAVMQIPFKLLLHHAGDR